MQISQDVLAVLSAMKFQGVHAAIIEQLDRKLYGKVNAVLEACGGKWNRKLKAHVFPSDAAELLDGVINTGEVTTHKDEGFFETPAPLARDLVLMAGVKHNHLVLEPSAGRGALVLAIQDAGGIVTACERNVDRSLYLEEKVLKSRDTLLEVDDFMHATIPTLFDRVVMNPPFCKVGEGDHIDHVQHAYSMLKPSGVLVTVLPASVTFRRDKRYTKFREWLQERGTIAPLPDNSFKTSGTGVRTVVVRLGSL